MNIKIDIEKAGRVLSELVRIPSVNPQFPGGRPEQEIADFIASYFNRIGLQVEIREVRANRPNIIGMLPGKQNNVPGLLLEAHMDTVQTTGMTIDPFAGEIKDGKLYGRGACDTKGSLAAMILAVEWFKENNIVPPVPVYLAATIDEEAHYLGILDIVELKHRFAAAIVGEPTDLQVVVAHKGCVRCIIEVSGTSAHSSKPEEGINAINQAIPVLQHISGSMHEQLKEKHHPLVGSPSICVTEIKGGVAHNTIPDRCQFVIDRRTIPGEDCDAVWQDIANQLKSLEAQEPSLQLSVLPPFITDFAMETAADRPIVRVLTDQAAKRLGSISVLGVPYGTNASKLAKEGIESVVFGPGSIQQAHTRDEWIALEEVVQAAEILIHTINHFTGPEADK